MARNVLQTDLYKDLGADILKDILLATQSRDEWMSFCPCRKWGGPIFTGASLGSRKVAGPTCWQFRCPGHMHRQTFWKGLMCSRNPESEGQAWWGSYEHCPRTQHICVSCNLFNKRDGVFPSHKQKVNMQVSKWYLHPMSPGYSVHCSFSLESRSSLSHPATYYFLPSPLGSLIPKTALSSSLGQMLPSACTWQLRASVL